MTRGGLVIGLRVLFVSSDFSHRLLLAARPGGGASAIQVVVSLGIAAAGDVFSVLIPKNTPVPAEEERIFTTNQDDQTEVEVRVSQGGAKRASDNQFLGAFILEGIPPARRMEPRICVTFHIDEDGILAVRARDDASQAEQGIRVEDPLGLRPTDPNESGKGSSLSDLPSDLEL